MHYNIIFCLLAAVIFCFTFANGFNDGCNTVATVIASRAMTHKKALVFAAAVELFAPFSTLLIGSGVVDTIKSIVNESDYTNPAMQRTALAFIAAGIIAAIIWNINNRILGIPASSTHSLVGGYIGAGIASFGITQVNWQNVLTKIVLMTFITPIVGLTAGFLVMRLLKYLFRYAGPGVNTFFKKAQVLNMAFLAFNHSFNDSQKSVGIIVMLMSIRLGYTGLAPIWALAGTGLALALGIIFGGYKIVKTVGVGIYRVNPCDSFASQITAGIVILISSLIGAPVSTSQIVSSSVMGVGSAERINAVRWVTVKKILFTWILTLPIAALLGALLFCAIRIML